MIPTDQWAEYYRLRKRARLSILAFPIVGWMLTQGPVADWVRLVLQELGPIAQVIFIFLVVGLATALIAVPLLQWAAWRCPRCGEKFVQPPRQHGRPGFDAVISVARSLFTESRCASCQLPCGAAKTGILS